jgi:excisionase family DNA binding protein
MTSLLEKPEVAEQLRVSVKTVERLVAAGDLQPVRIRDRILFDPQDVLAYIESRKREGGR